VAVQLVEFLATAIAPVEWRLGQPAGSGVRDPGRRRPPVVSQIEKIISFVQNVYVPDVCAIAGFYPDWFSYGAGVTNYLSVPDLPLDGKSTQFELPGGFIPNGDFAKLVPITGQKDETRRRAVTEDSAHAWYKGGGPLHPWKGETDPEPTEWDEEKKYSWVKAPRYNGQPAQVGRLADAVVG
jgi:hydrogenase large subunit